MEVGARAVFDVAARDDAVGESGIDDIQVTGDDSFPAGAELLEDVVIGDRGEDTGLLEPGRPHELVVRHRRPDPSGHFREAVAQFLAALDRLAVLLCIQEELRLPDHAFCAAEALQERVEVDNLGDRVGSAALLAVAKGGVRDPDVVLRIQGDRFAFELDQRRERVGELVAVVVRAGDRGVCIGGREGEPGSGQGLVSRCDDCIQSHRSRSVPPQVRYTCHPQP